MELKHAIIILDFGSQYTQLLAHVIRTMGVYTEVLSYRVKRQDIVVRCPIGIILSGGPASVTKKNAPQVPQWLFKLSVPLLGICYGMQAMAQCLGGKVAHTGLSEYGATILTYETSSRLFKGLQDQVLSVWMSHGDQVCFLPPQFKSIAGTDNTPIAAMEHAVLPWFALQFHPEVTHTQAGRLILSTFVFDICQAKVNWNESCIMHTLLRDIQDTVHQNKVLLGLSGGVDSAVVAMLLHRAIPQQLHCVFIDTGFLRQGEVEEVHRVFVQDLQLPVTFIDAQARFLKALKGIVHPETKRKVIGKVFIDLFHEVAVKHDIQYLAQGTIYPDVIESAQGNVAETAVVIKSHHNVGGLPETMHLTLLEPIRLLFKEEVKVLGKYLTLPEVILKRHPFPGPGLAVRILGEVKIKYVRMLQAVDAIFIQSLKEAGLYDQVSQAFAVFIPQRSVGVVGDARAYEYVIALRAIETQDFMTAKISQLPWDFLGSVTRRIINQVKGIGRVVYDLSEKPPATIEWE